MRSKKLHNIGYDNTAVNVVNNVIKTIGISVEPTDEYTKTISLTGVGFKENANNYILITGAPNGE